MKIITPETTEEFANYFDLRWRILREPWQQPHGSEKDELEDISHHVMICDDTGQAIGVGRLHAASDSQGQIRYMAVANTHQGKGVGSMLLNALENIARENNFRSILLHAREIALPFYLHHHYTQLEKSHLLFNSIQHFKMIKYL
jgi:N-acetylglutamate synthase-like GNAT family acetyltransferase